MDHKSPWRVPPLQRSAKVSERVLTQNRDRNCWVTDVVPAGQKACSESNCNRDRRHYFRAVRIRPSPVAMSDIAGAAQRPDHRQGSESSRNCPGKKSMLYSIIFPPHMRNLFSSHPARGLKRQVQTRNIYWPLSSPDSARAFAIQFGHIP